MICNSALHYAAHPHWPNRSVKVRALNRLVSLKRETESEASLNFDLVALGIFRVQLHVLQQSPPPHRLTVMALSNSQSESARQDCNAGPRGLRRSLFQL